MEILLEAFGPRRPDGAPVDVELPTRLVLRRSTSTAKAPA
jgi:hypothetical protein